VREVLAPPAERGHLEVRPRVVDQVGRISAREVDGVVAGRTGRLVGHELPTATSRVDGRRVRLDVEVATAWGRSATMVAAGVQEHVARRVLALTGLQVDAVHVTVATVVVPQESREGRVS